ncbi:FAD-dependent oxidoreductase [Sciscionella marina]|uniref:FAD-dependent oxidoreductase n=1 Tax=Sciscionella marina TaxID=508770 RepID=UPI000380D3A3|nr:FAD-dependent oxidoreductase [Sciscionella marina]
MSRNATIIGAGIAGLAAAIHLRTHGWRVEVHERDPVLSVNGTALTLWPGAMAALDTLGLGERARELGLTAVRGEYLRANGSRITPVDLAAIERKTGEPLRFVSRPALLGLLTEALPPDVLHLGSPVSAGELPAAEVLIGADGLRSTVRAVLFGARFRARYTGSTVWRGSANRAATAMTETWSEGCLFGTTPQDGGRTNWYASAPALETDRCPDGEPAALRARFGGWHSGIRAVLDDLDEHSVLRHGLYTLDPPLPGYVRGNAVLLGDAAHAMSPTLGRGGCEALIDGVVLARELVERARIADALTAYDARRRRPTQRLARAAGLVARMAEVRRHTAPRDTALRLAMRLSPAG